MRACNRLLCPTAAICRIAPHAEAGPSPWKCCVQGVTPQYNPVQNSGENNGWPCSESEALEAGAKWQSWPKCSPAEFVQLYPVARCALIFPEGPPIAGSLD